MTAASVFLSACGVFIVVSLRVQGKVTTKQPQCAPNDEGKLAAERPATVKTQQFDWGGKKRAPSTQLHADRRVGAAHLVWQRSSKSEGLKESDRLKEQLNYEAWMPRRGKRKHVDFFLLCLLLSWRFFSVQKQTVVGDPCEVPQNWVVTWVGD